MALATGIRRRNAPLGQKCSFQGFSIATQFLEVNATGGFLTRRANVKMHSLE